MPVVSDCTHKSDRCCWQVVEVLAQAEASRLMLFSAHLHVPIIKFQMQAASFALYPGGAKLLWRVRLRSHTPRMMMSPLLVHGVNASTYYEINCTNFKRIYVYVCSQFKPRVPQPVPE